MDASRKSDASELTDSGRSAAVRARGWAMVYGLVELAVLVPVGASGGGLSSCDDCSAPCGCGLSFAAGAIDCVEVADDVLETGGEDVAAGVSLAGALTITVRDAEPVRPFGSVTVYSIV